MRYRGKFTFLYVLYLTEEAELMIKNLVTYLYHVNRDKIFDYFIEEAREEVQRDKQDAENNRIVCATNEFTEEEELDDIGLEGTQKFLSE